MSASRPPRRLRRGAYLLPSLFTFCNILLGFYAVVCGFRGQFVEAGWMIIIAGVADGLDGRIARMTNTVSDFGKELDSLADVLTFGAAPAYLAHLWMLSDLGRIGWLVPVFFLLCTTVRLARFNVQVKKVDSRSFVGLPSPAGAGSIAVLMLLDQRLPEAWRDALPPVLLVLLVVIGSLMISTFRYPSGKTVDFRRRWSYRAAIGFGALLLVLAFKPEYVFQIFAVTYVTWGPLSWLGGRLRRTPTTGTLGT